MSRMIIHVDERGSLLILPQSGLVYRVDGSAQRVARSLRRELRLRSGGYIMAMAVSVLGWAISFMAGSVSFLTFGLMGISMVTLRLMDPPMFGNLDRSPHRISEMDSLQPREGLIALEGYHHITDTVLDGSTT